MLQLKADTALHTVSEIAAVINQATNDNNTKKMQAAWINEWLLHIGMLEVIGSEKQATVQGAELGIRTQQRYNMKRGNYSINLYNTYAQEFIYSNLEAIVDFHNEKSTVN